MTTFSYSSGNPGNLTGGHSASMSDISGPFGDITTFINGGNLDAGNLAANAVGTSELQALAVTGAKIAADTITATNLATAAKPVTLLGQYRTVTEALASYDAGDTSGSNLLCSNQGGLLPSGSSLAGGGQLITYLDPADHAVSGLTTRMRLRGLIATNATNPAVTFTFGLYPVSASGGAGTNLSITLGTVVTGSTIAGMSPGASQRPSDVSADFAPPTAGLYALGVSLSGAPATNAIGDVYARLEVHHI